MKISVLMENTALPGIRAEHGLSLLIETGGHQILFDMGQSGGFAYNARELGITLEDVDFAVLSHGHYDHGGGLGTFLELNDHAPVYVNCHAFEPHYHGAKYIGLDPKLAENPRIIRTDGARELAPGVILCTCPMAGENAQALSRMENGELLPEDFRHEQYLLVREGGKVILFSGCAHRGVVNITRHFQPDVLVGGFHFKNLDPASPELTQATRDLAELPTRYCTCHCTGQPQFAVMKKILGDRLQYLAGGAVIEI